ncbi:hypothetical protein AB0F13_10595 [Streptomyces sp. NPDC026206]|uniref:hypothetical protein n=1 Tax=Streptomyces sp. NPDC026206 TaxID=3157089 RepID=UPI0034056D08
MAHHPLRIDRIAYRAFSGGQAYSAADKAYFTDLADHHGLAPHDDVLAAGHTSFTAMTDALLGQLPPPTAPYDLLLLAHAAPDSEAGWPVCRACAVVPVDGPAFSLSDQGVAVPFTALRVVADHAARRALLLVMDQGTRPVGPPVPAGERGATGVALVLTDDGALGGVRVDQHAGVGPAQVPGLMESALATAGDCSVILGAALTPHWPAAGRCGPAGGRTLYRAHAGRPCTGLWTRLADELPSLSRHGGRLLLADYDPALGYLGLCTVDVSPETGPASSGRSSRTANSTSSRSTPSRNA